MNMTIHREGRKLLVALFLILLILNFGILYVWPAAETGRLIALIISAVLFVFFLQFFRIPRIKSVGAHDLVLSPANGKVVVIEPTKVDEYIEERRIQISIFMRVFDVHNNRNPVSGIVRYLAYHPGRYLVAWHPKSSAENERTTIVYETADGLLIPVRQIAGVLARRIKCYVSEGDEVAQGSEFGFIKFGSRLDVFLPLDAEVLVKNGEIVTGGKTVLARLKTA